MAEILTDYDDGSQLEIEIVNAADDKVVHVIFEFNQDKELVGGYADV